MRAFKLGLLILCASFVAIDAQIGGLKKEKNYRLPNATTPVRYSIELSTKIDRDNFKFNGNSVITIAAQEETVEIVLHSKQTDIGRVSVSAVAGGANVKVKSYSHDNETEFLKIELEQALAKGKEYVLKIEYSGVLREDKFGFYRSSYEDDDGKRVWLAATQFAPTEARHAFPCYDEPKYKTPFDIKITHPSDMKAKSNLKDTSVKNDDGTTTTTFEKTPALPTYLVGFVISNFEKLSKKSGKFELETYARSNALNMTDFAHDLAASVLNELTNFFPHVQLPLQTLKQFALPDFHFSGMENFGMISYRESRIFFDPNSHWTGQKVSAVALIAHEIAHHWFGDLVTPEWWTNVWLKEGFSTMYAYEIPEKFLPKWNLEERFQSNVLQLALRVDGDDKAIRSMTHYVERQKDIRKNYDKVAYEKSASVLRMFQHAIGRPLFKKAVDLYLEKSALKSVDEGALFDALDAANSPQNTSKPVINHSISKALKTWTSQSGYPVLTVQRNPGSQTLTLSQRRFLSNGDKSVNSVWEVPVTAVVGGKGNFSKTTADFWLRKRSEEMPLPGGWTENNWVLLNKQQTGYYRVNYDLKNWQMIAQHLMSQFRTIPTMNRAQLVDDVFTLANANYLDDFGVAFDLIRYMQFETEYSPWSALDANAEIIHRRLSNHSLAKGFGALMNEILEPQFGYLNLKAANLHPLEALTRRIILKNACLYNVPWCLKHSFDEDDLDLKDVMYCQQLKADTTARKTTQMLEILRNEKDIVVRADVIAALGCSSDERLLNLLLLQAIQSEPESKFLSNERVQLFASVYTRSYAGLSLTLRFVKAQWKAIKEQLSEGDLDTIVVGLSKYINGSDRKLLNEFYEMMGQVQIDKKTANSARRNVLASMEWVLRNEKAISDYFAKHNYIK